MPESNKDDKRLDALLAKLVETTISSEEFEELESLLDGNDDAQRRYLHYLGLHADMQEPGLPAAAGTGSASDAPRWVGRALLAVAAVIGLLAVAIVVQRKPEPKPSGLVDPCCSIKQYRAVKCRGDFNQLGVVGDGQTREARKCTNGTCCLWKNMEEEANSCRFDSVLVRCGSNYSFTL